MWIYEKTGIPGENQNPDPRMAKVIITQYGDPTVSWQRPLDI